MEHVLAVVLVVFVGGSIAPWPCLNDSECIFEQFLCSAPSSGDQPGVCSCPAGMQMINANTACHEAALYHGSACADPAQCSSLLSGYTCRPPGSPGSAGTCACAEGSYYLDGMCRPARGGFGVACAGDRDCYGNHDPLSLRCQGGACACAEGYYERQRRECRRLAAAIGEGCILDDDCSFPGGACDYNSKTCVDGTAAADASRRRRALPAPPNPNGTLARRLNAQTRLGGFCQQSADCEDPNSICSPYAICACARWFYPKNDRCVSELYRPSSDELCQGNFAQVYDGICRCPNGFFYDAGLQDCVKATSRFGDSCTSDVSCYTFGSGSYCHTDVETGLQHCLCDESVSVQSIERSLCISTDYQGVGDPCENADECRTATFDELECLPDEGQGFSVCTCPGNLTASVEHNLCLQSDLDIGTACQLDVECGPSNSSCSEGFCACSEGFFLEDSVCKTGLSGSCHADADCVVSGTVCEDEECRCGDQLVANGTLGCLPHSDGFNATCEETVQCTAVLGPDSSCAAGRCGCADGNHFRDDYCYTTKLHGEGCARNGECFAVDNLEMLQCRNGLCQCDFGTAYDEELAMCSGASKLMTSLTLMTLLFAIFRQQTLC